MRDGYVARWRGREYEASPDGDKVRLYQPEAGDGFEEVRSGRFVLVLPVAEVEDLAYVRTTCSWKGEPFIVLAEHDTWLRVEYTGGRRPAAGGRSPSRWGWRRSTSASTRVGLRPARSPTCASTAPDTSGRGGIVGPPADLRPEAATNT